MPYHRFWPDLSFHLRDCICVRICVRLACTRVRNRGGSSGRTLSWPWSGSSATLNRNRERKWCLVSTRILSPFHAFPTLPCRNTHSCAIPIAKARGWNIHRAVKPCRRERKRTYRKDPRWNGVIKTASSFTFPLAIRLYPQDGFDRTKNMRDRLQFWPNVRIPIKYRNSRISGINFLFSKDSIHNLERNFVGSLRL